ncbi:hypothetical protein BLNAU_23707 [Blattamonas nauphoetae]|uniref:Uncharacterized protein n=1 Tax=Blattamonas nauphoetae TaxID=2049346 RepID=A0ABQ9WPF7_9EUKA|nr:hypothetical protein BLNAU_23707 [Blattamonas nauphoetae]
MEVFNGFLGLEFSQSLVPAIRKMYNKIQKDMSDEFFSSLRLVPSDVDPKCQRFDLNMLSDCDWVEVFDQLEVEADGTIRLPKHGEFHPSSTHHAKTLSRLVTSIWDEWFSNLIAAVDPSTLPFTPDFLPLHAVLVDLMEDRLKRSGICRQFHQLGLDENWTSSICHSSNSLRITSSISLHPFALEADGFDTIVCSSVLSSHLDRNPFIHFRETLIEEMDSSALCSSKTGRTKDQYFKALESCLSLGLDSLLSHKGQNISTPVFKLFLSWHDYDSPRQGEWKGIYFETIPILMQYVMSYFYGQHSETIKDFVLWKDTIARVFCKLGFFIQIVNGLMIHDDSSRSLDFLYAFNRAYGERVQNTAQKREWDHGGKLCVDEEGWEDAMEFVLIPKEKRMTRMYGRMITEQVYVNMSICGANVGRMNR